MAFLPHDKIARELGRFLATSGTDAARELAMENIRQTVALLQSLNPLFDATLFTAVVASAVHPTEPVRQRQLITELRQRRVCALPMRAAPGMNNVR